MTIQEFTDHFEQSKPQLKSYILRMTVSVQDMEDAIQDTWIKASSNLASFKGESTIKTWIFSIASNLAIDNLRKKEKMAGGWQRQECRWGIIGAGYGWQGGLIGIDKDGNVVKDFNTAGMFRGFRTSSQPITVEMYAKQ